MAVLASPTLRLGAALALAFALSGCGKNPAGSLSATPTRRPVAAAASAAPATPVAPAPVVAAPQTGTVSIALSALQAPGITGVGIELTGPGLTSPIGKVLSPEELKTSNTLVFEHLPVGALEAKVVAYGEREKELAKVSSPVTVTATAEARVALLLSAPQDAPAARPVTLKFVAPEALEPKAEAAPPAAEAPAARPVSPASRALKLEIVDKQVIRKLLVLKRLQLTVRVTNDNPTETLKGEVKVTFHKTKGIFKKRDAVVETASAPVESLAPGKSTEITVTSTVSAEDAEATVLTVVAASSASTREADEE